MTPILFWGLKIALFLLAVAISLNLLGLFKLPVLGGESNPRGGFATPAPEGPGASANAASVPEAGRLLDGLAETAASRFGGRVERNMVTAIYTARRA